MCRADQLPSLFRKTEPAKMSKRKKISTKEETLPNYSEYAYSDIVESFTEHDRLLESDVQSLNCFAEYKVEWSLNSF